MPSPKKIIVIPDRIKSERGYDYPVDIIQEAYVRSDSGIQSFCKRYGLKEEVVEGYIQRGKWNELRGRYWDRMYQKFGKDTMEHMEWKQSVLQRLETLALIELDGSISDLERYVLKYGDTFTRDDNGEIVRDAFGNPLSRRVTPGMIEYLKELTDAKNKNIEKLAATLRDHPTLVPPLPLNQPGNDDTLLGYQDLFENKDDE